MIAYASADMWVYSPCEAVTTYRCLWFNPACYVLLGLLVTISSQTAWNCLCRRRQGACHGPPLWTVCGVL